MHSFLSSFQIHTPDQHSSRPLSEPFYSHLVYPLPSFRHSPPYFLCLPGLSYLAPFPVCACRRNAFYSVLYPKHLIFSDILYSCFSRFGCVECSESWLDTVPLRKCFFFYAYRSYFLYNIILYLPLPISLGPQPLMLTNSGKPDE